MKTLVKICGVRRIEDAILAERLGAQFIGCVLAKQSPRCATLSEVKAICVHTTVSVILVFRDATTEEVRNACVVTGVRRVQLHRSPDVNIRVLESEGLLVHRVLSVDDNLPDLFPVPTCDRPIVLDVGVGGEGRTFDWDLLGDLAPQFTFVAGGITPENVGSLLRLEPYGIDLSSGVESSPGVKDPERMQLLFAALRGVR